MVIIIPRPSRFYWVQILCFQQSMFICAPPTIITNLTHSQTFYNILPSYHNKKLCKTNKKIPMANKTKNVRTRRFGPLLFSLKLNSSTYIPNSLFLQLCSHTRTMFPSKGSLINSSNVKLNGFNWSFFLSAQLMNLWISLTQAIIYYI